ncbi:hypothetical protein DCAR_0625421 [Daucus carota subsp. sativus]|uniref:Uncharacterized protein n=1 Tax=Daucus carota subsp. sativus TaxID=79200 RepID=A0A164WFI8_DAUCS|nr:PREDICTED: uncharacterized protein LOC108226518 [Daucus carota subsp. sativus]WOH05998.1 hypothetical protein DCAR_0625421 [Daucus carota subsp. sativus]
MSSILNSSSVVLATAMAVSGTVIVLAFRLQKLTSVTSPSLPRSCISSDEKKKDRKKKKKVHFAEDVVDPIGNSEDFRKKLLLRSYKPAPARKMPANRTALYAGILRDRVVINRPTYSC